MEILEVAPRTVPRSWLCLGRRRRVAGYQPEWPWWPRGSHRRVGASGGHTHDAVLRELVVRQPDTSDRVRSRRSVTGRRSLHGDDQWRTKGSRFVACTVPVTERVRVQRLAINYPSSRFKRSPRAFLT